MQNISSIIESDKSLIHFTQQASDPFQFLAKVVSNDRVSYIERVRGFNSDPVTQDASASAYQIMSYLLMNEEMARQTNLIPSPDQEIQDMYECLKHDLLKYLREVIDRSKISIIESRLTRKVVKQLFMPLIYGKTVLAMGDDISEVYGSLLRKKEFYSLAKSCYAFWVLKYPDILNLMRFINLIGWFCSEIDLPVLYGIPYFTTVQDYMRSNKEEVWVYDRVSKKRRRVTLRVPTLDRDKRKSQVATCVNFIHQKDAFIAMKVVEELSLQNVRVYTVHDNFITTAVSAGGVSKVYTKVFMEMGPPLRIINEFIMLNLIRSSIPLKFDWVNDPIPGDELQTLLRDLEPQDQKFDKKKWNQKIQEAVSCYEKYINTVCGGQRHADKWNSFHSLLNSWESLGVNYSVHY
jgi:DNA-directed RNA polymerase